MKCVNGGKHRWTESCTGGLDWRDVPTVDLTEMDEPYDVGSFSGISELQIAIDKFNDENKDKCYYEPDYKKKVKVNLDSLTKE